ncbi:hypothetical protein acsn021_10800 [Anaerocolumna cellulosilytica]|uniref:Uncharacterized protein n=1 Tax=Anaerocolumna cellulosilytica TaxID=433286 RepID=A0A6S6R2X2_9FIRM|nr:APC family permease [Anaerocolumna cellulosilytica]MBB5194567.1 APA family basic amino acid/polyamine antiporter [Anaerocolumna cellulosilytica]BCJ93511.1 hypothetical protein acsn021_10800 [Anaerocolumna cellulosilytica]
MDNKNKQHYGLFTATTMIIGIVIGSGIFFKSDDVLIYTGGSVELGVIAFIIGAFSIIFGSLTLSEFAVRTKHDGGIIGYYEEFISVSSANGFGWFQTFIYFPTIIVVISWVTAIYIFSFLGIEGSVEQQVILGLIIFTVFYCINTLSYKLGGHIQNITTIVKLIPLFLIALTGLFYSGQDIKIPEGTALIPNSNIGLAWLAALPSIAFSFDGWIVSINITNEVENPKKNMPLALIIGPLTVLIVYLLYFLGLNTMLGPDYIMATGNEAVNKAGEILFGNFGIRLLLIFIIISILGVVNGMTLGSIRMPQNLAFKKMLPDSKTLAKIHPKYELSLSSALCSYLTCVVWMLLHYFSLKSNIFKGGDISENAIVFSYICYILLYIKVLKLKKKNIITSFFKGVVCPILGLLGSLIILVGGLISTPLYASVFILFCCLVCLAGYLYSKRRV